MNFLLDVETCSACDLKAAGSWAYAQHPTTDMRCAAWVCIDGHLDTMRVHSWQPGDPPPVFGPEDRLHAWGDFDRLIWRFVLSPRYGWPVVHDDRWENLMLRAAYGNLPMSLEKAALVLSTGVQKDMAGHRLMMRLSRPAKPTIKNNDPNRHADPAAIAALVEYCRQDVRAEAAAAARLPKLPVTECVVQEVDRKINARGIQMDMALVQSIQDMALGYAERLTTDLCKLTKGAVKTSTQLKQLAQWLRTQGVEIPEGKGAMDKDAVAEHLKRLDPKVPAAQALQIRRELGKSSLSKLTAIKAATGADGRLRGSMQHYGAHQTGRWAGRIVQPQNLPKGVLDSENMLTYHIALEAVRSGDLDYMVALYGPTTMDVLASLIRCCFIPKPGYILATADWNAIEPRVVAWMAQAKTLLQVFADGTDPYKVAAAMAYSIDVGAVTKKQRNAVGKPQIIGCGYGMGQNKLADTFHIDADLAQLCVDTFRQRLAPEVPALWRSVEGAAKRAMLDRGTLQRASCLQFKADAQHLYMRLPSGRVLWYRDCNFQEGKYGPEIHFMAENGMTHLWEDTHTWGGTLVENADQAISSCLLRDTLVRAESSGLNPVMHIHDEVLCEVREDHAAAAEKALVQIMESPPEWAKGLPIAAKPDLRTFYVK